MGTPAITLSITPRGVLAHIPVLETACASFADLSWTCDEQHKVLMVLSPEPVRVDGYPSYVAGHIAPGHRMVVLRTFAEEYTFFSQGSTWKWTDVYLLDDPPPRTSSQATCPSIFPMNVLISPPQQFQFPSRNIEQFISELNGTASGHRAVAVNHYTLTSTTNVGPIDDDTPTSFIFTQPMSPFDDQRSTLIIQVGRCRTSSEDGYKLLSRRSKSVRSLWARVFLGSYESQPTFSQPDNDQEHDCSRDHVSRWPSQAKDFSFASEYSIWFRVIRLSFLPSLLDPNCRTLRASANWTLAGLLPPPGRLCRCTRRALAWRYSEGEVFAVATRLRFPRQSPLHARSDLQCVFKPLPCRSHPESPMAARVSVLSGLWITPARSIESRADAAQ